jgi:hypothetical protein
MVTRDGYMATSCRHRPAGDAEAATTGPRGVCIVPEDGDGERGGSPPRSQRSARCSSPVDDRPGNLRQEQAVRGRHGQDDDELVEDAVHRLLDALRRRNA